jgi:hypothetical protein
VGSGEPGKCRTCEEVGVKSQQPAAKSGLVAKYLSNKGALAPLARRSAPRPGLWSSLRRLGRPKQGAPGNRTHISDNRTHQAPAPFLEGGVFAMGLVGPTEPRQRRGPVLFAPVLGANRRWCSRALAFFLFAAPRWSQKERIRIDAVVRISLPFGPEAQHHGPRLSGARSSSAVRFAPE